MLENDIVGYCNFHNYSLDENKLRNKSCLYKHNSGTTCRHLKRNLNHRFWINRQKRFGDNAIRSKYIKFKL